MIAYQNNNCKDFFIFYFKIAILPLLFCLKIGVKYGRLCLKMASHWLLFKSLAYAYKLGWGRPPSYVEERGNTWTEFLHIIPFFVFKTDRNKNKPLKHPIDKCKEYVVIEQI